MSGRSVGAQVIPVEQVAPPGVRGAVAGALAIQRHAPRLEVIAAGHGWTVEQLLARLRSDPALRVTAGGELLYVDPLAPASSLDSAAVESTVGGPTGAAAPFPYSSTFALHSKPGSKRTIVLDFDGHTLPGSNGWGVSAVGAWDVDGSPATFSAAEHDVIQGVWQRMAEDFAPFDVNVTTQDPGAAAVTRSGSSDEVYGTRAVFTTDAAAWAAICNSGCGGIAYVGVFDLTSSHDTYQPAFVFGSGTGNTAKGMAEAGSHEVGHNLGLSHDGTSVVGYYAGHTPWAPIMGVGYDQPVSQWSRGEYAGANNLENDITVMAANGAIARADDHGDTRAAATSIGASDATFVASGVIDSQSDVDVVTVSHGCAATLSATLAVAPTGANLDARLRLLDAAGSVLAVSDPAVVRVSAATAGGLDAAVSVSAPAGTYYVEVDGIGWGTTSSGYGDYGSLGAYTVSGTKCAGAPPPPPPPPPSGKLCRGLAVTVDLTLGQVPTAGSDVILGTSGADVINGGAGNDVICGLAGADVLDGGTGSDVLDGGDSSDTLRGGAGDDVMDAGAGSSDLISYSDASAGVVVSLAISTSQATGGAGADTITAAERLVGSPFADTLRGTSGVDTIWAGGGNDTVLGGDGNDSVKGEAGSDVVHGEGGNDAVSGGSGTDTCDGGAGTDTRSSCETSTAIP